MPTVQRGQVFRLAGGSWAYRYRDAAGTRRQSGGFKTRAEASAVLEEQLRRAKLGGLYRERITLAGLKTATWRSTSATRRPGASWHQTYARPSRPSGTCPSSFSSPPIWRRGAPLFQRVPGMASSAR